MITGLGLDGPCLKGFATRRAKRSAFSLIEMVSVLVLFTAAMAISLSIMQRLVAITRNTTTRTLALREANRFSAIFRADAHNCQRVEISKDGHKLIMVLAGGEQSAFECSESSIAYQLVAPKSHDLVAADQVKRSDAFLLPLGAKARFREDQAAQLVSLLLFDETPATPRIQIDAAILPQGAEEATRDDAT